MKNLLAAAGIITLLCFFPVSETSAYFSYSVAFEGNYVWCATDSGLVKMNRLDGTYQVFDILGSKIVVDYENVKWFKDYYGEGVVSFNEIELKSYTINDGLVDNTINAIAVDHNNVKWFATPSGVSSFDGVEWKTFTSEDGLVINNVLSMAVDHNNVKWFGTLIGISSYNDTTWTTFDLTDIDIPQGLNLNYYNDWNCFNDVYSIAVDSENVIWLGCSRIVNCVGHGCEFELVLISLEGTTLTFHQNTLLNWGDDMGAYYGIFDIGCGIDNKIWYSEGSISWAALRTYDKNTGDITNVSGACLLEVDNEGIVWLGGYSLRSFDEETWTSYSFDFPVTTVEAPETPLPFTINSIYPNPFNASTTISFSHPASGFTQLVIYNISGQKVREIATETMNEGVHNVVWDGMDDGGVSVSSGVYISRLSFGKLVTHKRMLLMK